QKQQETFLVEESRPVQRIRHEHRRIETTQVTPRQVQVVRTMVTEPPPRPPPPPPPPVVVEPVERPVSHLSPTKSHPNKVFLDCCLAKNVDKACESRCNFDVISKKVLTGMFLGSDPCPQSYGLDLFTCAAQDADHRECCKRKNVQRTSAGEKCLAFCNMAPGSHFQADATYLPCWAVLNDVKTCFKEAILEVE
ncbi:DB module family protein, partial [Aphelenchoides avenae]